MAANKASGGKAGGGPAGMPHVAVLTSGTVQAQANLLLELCEQLAEGKAVTRAISDVCREVVAPATADPVIKRLAYDAIKITPTLSAEDWSNICRGLAKDISRDQPLEVLTRALETVVRLPDLQLQRLADVGDIENKVTGIVLTGSPDVQAQAIAALAHILACPTIACPLFSDRGRLEAALQRWCGALDATIGSGVPRVTHGGIVAIDGALKAWEAATSTRDLTPNEALVAVRANLAWAGAYRLRAYAAHTLTQVRGMAAPLQAECVTALTSILHTLLVNDAPVRLGLDGRIGAGAATATTEGEAGWERVRVEQGWIYGAFGSLCVQLLDSQDAATVAEAARAVLHLRSLERTQFPRFYVAPCPDHWMFGAVAALLRIGAPADEVLGREAAAQSLCRYLSLLPPREVPDIVRVILPWILQRSGASARVGNLMLVWRAIVDIDLNAWRERAAPDGPGDPSPNGAAPNGHALRAVPPGHAATLLKLLEDPLVRALRADNLRDWSGFSESSSPTLSQEAVSTLLEVLLTHEGANAAIEQVEATRAASAARAPGDLQDAVQCAALLEVRRTAAEWAQIALLALQGSQGCLGWDSGAPKAFARAYPATVTADRWFVLALRTQHVLRALKSCEDIAGVKLSSDTALLPRAEAESVEIARGLRTAESALQGMFLKILKFWRSLSKAAAPRAIWVLVHHLKMPAVEEELWEALFEALRELLLYQPGSTAEMHTQELEMSTRNGALPYSAGAQGVNAAERPLLVGGQLLHLPEAEDWWDVCAEGVATGILALDRVALTLWTNYPEHYHLAGYQALVRTAATLADQLRRALPRASGLRSSVERLQETLRGVVDVLPADGEELAPEELYDVDEVAAPAAGKPRRPSEAERGGTAALTPVAEAEADAGGDGRDAPPPGAAPASSAAPAPGRPVPAPPKAPQGAAPAAPASRPLRDVDGSAAAAPARAAAPTPARGGSTTGSAVGTANGSPAEAQKGQSRSSNRFRSGAKGVGNKLGLRKKRNKTPVQTIAQIEKAGSAVNVPPPPVPVRKGSSAPGGATRTRPPSKDGRLDQILPFRRAAPAAPAPVQRAAPEPPTSTGPALDRHYKGPCLTPLSSGYQPLEGYPFGAPTSITMADSSRMKRHVMFESQLTSCRQVVWEAYRDASVRVDASNALAELMSTVGTLPAPMQLARSIDPASVHRATGAAVVAVPGKFVELTSGQEPLRLFVNVEMDWAALRLVVHLRAQSMLEESLSNVVVRVHVQGGVATFVGASTWSIGGLEGLDIASHVLRLALLGSGALTLRPEISFHAPPGVARAGGAGGPLLAHPRVDLATGTLRVPISLQLKTPRVPLSAEAFFQRFHTWHHACTISGTCTFRGAEGGLALLDIIEKKAFKRTYLRLLPALGGFQAAYLAYDATNRAVGVVVTAQLTLIDRTLSALTAEADAMASASHCLVRVTTRAGGKSVATSIDAAPALWLHELTDGAVAPTVASLPDSAPPLQAPLLSNQYAHLAVQFRADLTPDPDADPGEPDAEEDATALHDAAKDLAAFAKAKDEAEDADELQVDTVPEQQGDDWLHMAVLSQWQQMRDALGVH